MEKVTSEQLKAMQLQGKGRTSPVYIAISMLQRGENLMIPTKEYTLKSHPSHLVARITRKTKATYSVAKILDGSGWIISRVR